MHQSIVASGFPGTSSFFFFFAWLGVCVVGSGGPILLFVHYGPCSWASRLRARDLTDRIGRSNGHRARYIRPSHLHSTKTLASSQTLLPSLPRRRRSRDGPEEGQGPAAVVEAGQVRRWQAEEEEVEQGKAKGEGEQRRALRPGHLRQAALRGAQVQADHPLRPLRAPQDQWFPGSEGHQGPDGAWPDPDGGSALKPADLHQGDQHLSSLSLSVGGAELLSFTTVVTVVRLLLPDEYPYVAETFHRFWLVCRLCSPIIICLAYIAL